MRRTISRHFGQGVVVGGGHCRRLGMRSARADLSGTRCEAKKKKKKGKNKSKSGQSENKSSNIYTRVGKCLRQKMRTRREKKCPEELGPSGDRSGYTLLHSLFPPDPRSMASTRTPFRALSRASQFLGSRRPWTCASCKNGRTTPRCGFATAPEQTQKPYYVTTPIFYVNAGEFVWLLILSTVF